MTLCLPNKLAGPNHRTNEKWAVGRAGRAGRGGSSGARAYLQAVGAARATGGEESFEPGSLAALRLDGVRAREGGRQGGVFGSVFGVELLADRAFISNTGASATCRTARAPRRRWTIRAPPPLATSSSPDRTRSARRRRDRANDRDATAARGQGWRPEVHLVWSHTALRLAMKCDRLGGGECLAGARRTRQ